MFQEEAIRLLREKWENPTMLAEELYAMFQAQSPAGATINAPVKIVNPGGQEPTLTVQSAGQLPQIQIQGPTGGGNITFDNGQMQYTPFVPEDLPPSTSFTQDPVPQPLPATSSSGSTDPVVFVGQVSSGGPGNTYQVTIYPDGPTKTGTLVTCTQLSIANTETIPQFTWTIVVKVGSDYLMQVPVWL